MKLGVILLFISSLLMSCGGSSDSNKKSSFNPGVVNPQSVEAQLLMRNNWCEEIEHGDGIVEIITETNFRDIKGNVTDYYYEDGELVEKFDYKYSLNYPTLKIGNTKGFEKITIELFDGQLILKDMIEYETRDSDGNVERGMEDLVLSAC